MENKYFKKVAEDWDDNEYVYDYITRIQNKYNINIWFYRPLAGNSAKVERVEKCSVFVKSR